MSFIFFFILLIETAQPLWVIPDSVIHAISRDSGYTEELVFIPLFPSQPLKGNPSTDREPKVYVAATEKRLYAFWKDSEGRFKGKRYSLSQSTGFSPDYSCFRLIKEGMHQPELIEQYLTCKKAMNQAEREEPALLYAALFPDLPHPAIPYPELDKDRLKLLSEATDFIKRYNHPLFLSFQSKIKSLIDETAPSYD